MTEITQEQIDEMAARCGLLPHARFLAEVRPTFRADIPANRANGRTTQKILRALALAEQGRRTAFVGSAPEREHARRQLYELAQAAGLLSDARERIRFTARTDNLRGLTFDEVVAL